jgi:RNA polymerase sigma-70 factor (ECF subfamily)
VAQGDKPAFSRLYTQMAPKLFGQVLRICRDRSLAEEALQEVFADVWRQADRYDPDRAPARAWLSVIARNRAIDVLRRGRPGTFVGGEAGAVAIDNEADQRAATDGGVEFMTLIDCLGRLDERTREMVLMAYYEGWTREELSEQFGNPVNTIKTWLRRGLSSLRGCLEGS